MRERLTVGDGFRVAFGFWLFHVVLAVIVALGWIVVGIAAAGRVS